MSYGEKIHAAYLSRSPDRSAVRPMLRRRVPHRLIYVGASLLLIAFFYFIHQPVAESAPSAPRPKLPRPAPKRPTVDSKFPAPASVDKLPCAELPGADDVVVVLKTGSTELLDKLPVHLNTTLRCYPNYMIFSDYEEDFRGEHIYDALEFTSQPIKDQNPDFELWRRLQAGGRAALKPKELSGPISRPNSALGKPENPGWKLDKWKFLPMVNRTLAEFPDKKWYVFVETDTYILWQSLLVYLRKADWKKPYYMGGQIWIGDIQFAHGGTGFAASRPAMESVVRMFQDRQQEWESFTNGHWAGDCVLGKAFKDAGAPMTSAWPIWQGDDIGHMNYPRVDGHRLWCFPTVSYHHVSPMVVESMWRFEQDWMSKTNRDPSEFLHHYQVYSQYILPQISKPRRDWYNHANEDRGPVPSLEACQEICESDPECLQYALSTDNRCLSASTPNLGEWYKGMESGWMPQRMSTWAEHMKSCKGETWLLD